MRLRPCAAWLAMLLTTACATEADDPVVTGPSCGANTMEVDGACVSVFDGDWGWDDVFLAEATACDGGGDGRIDPVTGCIGEVCLDDTIGELRATWGLGDCEYRPYGHVLIEFCEVRGQDVEIAMPLLGGEGVPDAVVTGLAFDGRTADGVGPGVSTGCAWSALGEPNQLWLQQDVARQEMLLQRAYWLRGAVSIESDGAGAVTRLMLGGWL